MSWRDHLKPLAAKVRKMVCPDCGKKLVRSTNLKGCWIPFHFRCVECAKCWRDDGTGRGCRCGGGYTNSKRYRS
jgi:predicted amidophosphoribosyltransferase